MSPPPLFTTRHNPHRQIAPPYTTADSLQLRPGSETPPPPPPLGPVRMDPDCAICASPANVACECEAKSLELAVKHAEQRVMQTIYQDIRQWARSHAQDYILNHFRTLTTHRQSAHAAHIDRLTTTSYRLYNLPPSPSELAAAQLTLKRGIDQDWRDSVARYPDVLEYFFSLVDLTLPSDTDPAVKNPPLHAIPAPRKAIRRPTTASLPSGPRGPSDSSTMDMTAYGYDYDRGGNGDMMIPGNALSLATIPRRGLTPPGIHQQQQQQQQHIVGGHIHSQHHGGQMVRRPLSPPGHLDRRTPGPREERRISRRISYRGPAQGGYYSHGY